MLGRLVAGAGAGGETGDAGQRLVKGGAAALPLGPELEEAGLGDAGPVRPEGATLPASWRNVASMVEAPASSWAETCWSCSGVTRMPVAAMPLLLGVVGCGRHQFYVRRQTNVHSPKLAQS